MTATATSEDRGLPVRRRFSSSSAASSRRRLTAIIIICWLLSAVCFTSSGGAPGGELGAFGAAKALTRVVSLLILGGMLITGNWASNQLTIWRLVPLGVFSAWTIASTVWSPLLTITLSHGLETLMLAMLAMVAGLVCREEAEISRLLLHLVIIICLVCLVLAVVNYPVVMAGFRPDQLMQPNNIGAVAAAGLITMAGARNLWNWKWARYWFVPVMLLCGGMLLLTRSRSCILLTAAVLLPLLMRIYRAWLVVAILLAAGLLAAVWPFSRTVASLPDTVTDYMMRGQTSEDMYTVSGRTELWTIAVDSFQDAPIIGHGYYVMTRTGSMRVWGAERWQTAHNTYLHVITGLGLFGFALLCWALIFALGPMFRALWIQGPSSKLHRLAMPIVLWCLVLGCFELSFAGPVDPMVLTFFIMVGLAAGSAQKGVTDAHPSRS